MKIKSFILTLTVGIAAHAEMPFVNLTPTPKNMTQTEGTFVLPHGLTVSSTEASFGPEIEKFITALNRTTDLEATNVDSNGTIRVSMLADAKEGQYNLTVTAEGVAIEAGEPTGLYYAFQTIKKILPANVMAGVKVAQTYELPLVDIQDEPRFEYRGFMLDCCRHFFPLDDVKRMIEAMSYYKMNKFHWHLTEDQGWRFEMPQYPRLQTVGATAPNCQIVDMWTKTEYWLNKPYGPYYYTQDEMRELVAFAAERHIDVIPEIEMPGHLSALMTAYPEFSCNPAGGHSVAITGGVYNDVLNVANPAAIKFAEDVIDACADIFPYEVIHIGGDECPDNAWKSNEECQALMKREGMTSERQLQSHFTKHIADYAAKRGKRLGVWNESITMGGTDTEMMKKTGATVWCWYPAESAVNKAVELGLPCIYTPFSKTAADKGSFYINRSQDPNDPPANGYKCDDVKSVYSTSPFTTNALKSANKHLAAGVQGTFWTERVGYREYLEYLALPRLLAIAEIGWTPQSKKNWESFQKRMSADRELLDFNGYQYSPYWMLERDEPSKELCPMPELKAGMQIMFKSLADDFKGASVFPYSNGTLGFDVGNFGSKVWTIETASHTASGDTAYITLRNVYTNLAISGVSATAVSGMGYAVESGETPCEIKVWQPRPDVNEGVMMSINGLPLWLMPYEGSTAFGTIRAGENKYQGSGVSPNQGGWFEVVPAEQVMIKGVDTEGNVLYENQLYARPLGSEVERGLTEDLYEQVGVEGTTVIYRRVANKIFYNGVLENDAIVRLHTEILPLDQPITANVPEVPFFSLVSASEPQSYAEGSYMVNCTYETECAVGAAKTYGKAAYVEPGKAYLIRDAHVDRNAYRCATAANTVSGAKSAENVSPMFVWTLEEKGSNYKVKNLGNGLYVNPLERSTTAKMGKTGGEFTLTYNPYPASYWTFKGTNGQYWDGLDNLDLVGWPNGNGHPIEIYRFYASPYFRVNVTSVDNKGNELATATRFAVPGERHVLEVPYRKGYLATSVEGEDQLLNVKSDVDVRIVYTPESELGGLSEVTAAAANGDIYDLQGRKVLKTRRGFYIQNGKKTLVK